MIAHTQAVYRPIASEQQSAELVRLRRELQVEHERLLISLKGDYDRLRVLGKESDEMDAAQILTAYGALIAMIAREDFEAMSSTRMPVVLSQISARLARLGRLLRSPLRARRS